MISVFIDTQQISQQFDLDQDQINDLLDYTIKQITNRFAEEWINEANRTLKSSRQEYISNINVVDEGFAKGAVVLTGEFANMVEQGVDAFDMKPTHLAGPNAKQGADGKMYNTVPFSAGAPTSLSENFSNIIPKPIHDVIKAKPFEVVLKGGGVSTKPLTEQEIPQQFRAPVTKKVKLGDGEYTHKSSIWKGLTRQKDPITKQVSYTSFRRISENSDKFSWIHPGIEKFDLAGEALQNFDIPNQVGNIFDRWFELNFR